MRKRLLIVIAILIISFSANAQTPTPTQTPMPTFTPTPMPESTPRPDGLTDNDISAVNGLTVNVKSVELLYERKNDVNDVTLKVVFDQTFREIDRVSTIFGQMNFESRFSSSNAYHLMELATGNRLNLTAPAVEDNYITFKLDEDDAKVFDKSKKYTLFFRGLKLSAGTTAENPSVTAVTVLSVTPDIPETFAAVAPVVDKPLPSLYEYAKKNFTLDENSPEVKIDFSVTGERVTKPAYATVINAEPFELKRLGLRGAYSIVPIFLNLEKNDAKGSEVDKLKFGTKFRHLIVFEDDGKYVADPAQSSELKTSRFIGIRSELTPQIETTTRFKNMNFILGFKTGLPINLIQTRSQSMRIFPFAGFDGGYRIFNGDRTSKEKWIARPSFGAEFYYTPFRTENNIPLQIDANFVLRAFLRREEIYTRDADRKPIVEGLSSNPKAYFNVQITLWKTKFLSPTFRYSYGRDTPQYLLEDHKYTFGVSANFDWGK